MKTYMAIDQYGITHHGLKYPRKEFAELFPGHISKMYVDNKKGETFHIGYVIGKHWFSIYEVTPIRRKI